MHNDELLQHIQYVLESTGRINRLPRGGIHAKHHIMKLFVGNGVTIWCYRHFGIVTPRSGEGEHLRHPTTISTTIVSITKFAAVTQFAVFHQVGGERFFNYPAGRLER